MAILLLGERRSRVFEQAFGRPVEMAEEEPDPATLDPFRVAEMTPLQRAQLVARVVAAYPHLKSLAPAHLFADAVEPEPDDRQDNRARDDPTPVRSIRRLALPLPAPAPYSAPRTRKPPQPALAAATMVAVSELDTVERATILRGTVGSTVHGLHHGGQDDRDEMAVFVEPPEYLIGLGLARKDGVRRPFRFEHWVEHTQPEGARSAGISLSHTASASICGSR